MLRNVCLLLLLAASVYAGQTNYTYDYRRAITINNTANPNTLTDYQIPATIDTSDTARFHNSCADLRFTSDAMDWNEQNWPISYPYWIESGCGTATTKVWVKVDSIAGSSLKTIYIYYGNASAASASSASNTFIREISGVIGAWDLNGDALDRSGNGNNGMLNGGMGYATGLFGQAARFDGSDDKINISDDNDLDLTNFSITGWVYINSTTGTHAALFSKTTATSINYELTYTTSIYFQIYDGTNYHQVRTGPILPDRWYFLSGTRNSSLGASQQLKLYLAGILNSTAVYTVGNPQSIQNNGEVLFGRNEYQNKWGNNSQSNFRLYNKVLNPDEIYDLYGSGGDRIGLVTTDYAGKELVRKYTSLEPMVTIGQEQQPDTTPPAVSIQINTIAGIADGNITFSFTPATLRIRAGSQEYPQKALKASAGVDRFQIRTKVTTSGQAAPDGTKVTYTLSE